MRGLLNLLWIIFGGGFLIWLEYIIAGVLLCLTIVGIPFGVQCFKIAELGLLPFGREIAPGAKPPGLLTGLMNIIWLIVGGVWIALSHVILGVGAAITIIGIPFALQHLKLIELALWPFGAKIRRTR